MKFPPLRDRVIKRSQGLQRLYAANRPHTNGLSNWPAGLDTEEVAEYLCLVVVGEGLAKFRSRYSRGERWLLSSFEKLDSLD